MNDMKQRGTMMITDLVMKMKMWHDDVDDDVFRFLLFLFFVVVFSCFC